jgi:putative colanic acid biosynthesis acetyltransferase WcaF
LSQGVYLCTGSHDWKSSTFDLITKPISLQDGVWLCARSTVGPGVNIDKGAVLTLAAVAVKDLDSWSVYAGSPAKKVKSREKIV